MFILYVGLGFAMISGLSAMMQIGNNVNNLMFLSAFKQNDYYQSSLPSYDRKIMDILNNYSGPKEDICKNVKNNFNDTFYEEGEMFLSSGTQTPSTNSLFEGACVLVNKELKHRVLINKNEINGFNLFSCYLKNKPYCTYEIEK